MQSIEINDTHTFGNPFFLQIPSIDQWTNMNVLFRPCGFPFDRLLVFIRIYTSSEGVGQLNLDGSTIEAEKYQQISNSDYFYYEMQTSDNSSHRISPLNENVIYSVGLQNHHY